MVHVRTAVNVALTVLCVAATIYAATFAVVLWEVVPSGTPYLLINIGGTTLLVVLVVAVWTLLGLLWRIR